MALVDHLVVAAPSLDEGARWCEAALGIRPGAGGQHPSMGTHNRLFNIGSEAFPQAFFEIIAIDPAAHAPGRARWFGLDAIDLGDGPRLLHFVARSSDVAGRGAALHAAGFDIGRVLVASRATPQGRLEWRIGVRDDGRLLAGGALPTLIDWGHTPHPALSMPASGVTLRGLSLRGLPLAAAQVLGLSGVEVLAEAGPAISAVLDTPRGRVTLTSH